MPDLLTASPSTIRLRSRLRTVLALLCAWTLAWPVGRAFGDTRTPTRAVVVAKDLDSPIVQRLRAELTAQGFESLAVWGPPTAPSPSELASIARGADALAVLRFDQTARMIEVWLYERGGASPVLVDTVRVSGVDDGGVAAIQAAASLRAALVRREAPPAGALLPALLPSSPAGGQPPSSPPSVPAPPPPVVAAPPGPGGSSIPLPPPAPVAIAASVAPAEPAPTSFARLTLAIGVSAIVSAGGIGPIGDVSLAATWHPVAAWSIGLFGQLPVLSATLTGPRGRAQVGATLLGAEVAHVLGRSSWRIHPDVALGAGVVSLHLAGTAASPSGAAPTVDAWMAAALARGGVAVEIAREWRLRADAILGLVFPQAEVVSEQVQLATWGRPIATGAVSVEVVLH
jgi:hypothetical protein